MDMVKYRHFTFFLGLFPVNVSYLLNMTPSKSIDETPYEIWAGK